MSKTLKFLALISILAISACSSKTEPVVDGSSDMDGYTEDASMNNDDVIEFEGLANDQVISVDGIEAVDLENYEPDTDANIAFMTDVVNIVFFDFNSSEVNPVSRAVLEDQAAWLEVNPEVKIMIEGHCDERGTREYNLALGAKRAMKTKDYLVALGVAENRISTISYGKERPMILNSTAEAWSKNRRAVSILY